VDHDITDEQPFSELAREKYSCTERVIGTGVHITFNENFHTNLNGGSNRFEVYEFSMLVNEKAKDQDLVKENFLENWPCIRCPN